MNNIAIIITTFERYELLSKSIESLVNNYKNNFKIIIVDQGNITKDKKQWILDNKLLNNYYILPYNSGLSYCRNYGVEKAKELGCDYCLIGSDSFLFNESIKKINELVNILEYTHYDLIGMELSGCVCDWEATLKLIEGESFELNFINKEKELAYDYLTEAKESKEWRNDDGSPALVGDVINVWDCDIMRNFFLAKTDTLLDVEWDNDFKLGEHEDFFWRYKQAGYTCGWTDYIDAVKMTDRPDKYAGLRKTNFNNGLSYLRKKYNISGWVTYVNLERAKRNNK